MSRTHAAIWALLTGAMMLALEAGWGLIFGWHWFEPSNAVVFAGGVYTGGRIGSLVQMNRTPLRSGRVSD